MDGDLMEYFSATTVQFNDTANCKIDEAQRQNKCGGNIDNPIGDPLNFIRIENYGHVKLHPDKSQAEAEQPTASQQHYDALNFHCRHPSSNLRNSFHLTVMMDEARTVRRPTAGLKPVTKQCHPGIRTVRASNLNRGKNKIEDGMAR